MLSASPLLGQRRQLCIPRAGDVARAASLLPQPVPEPLSRFGHQVTRQSPRAYEGAKWFVDVAPGLIRIRRKLAAERVHFGHDDGVDTSEDRRTRGRVIGMSDRSRARMTQTVEELDFGPMYDAAPGEVGALITLTLPGLGDDGDEGYWERLVPDPATYKRMVKRLKDDYYRAWGRPLIALHQTEYQRRGAPHEHIFCVPPGRHERTRMLLDDGYRMVSFRTWLSRRWANIVGAEGGAYRRHVDAGTRVDYDDLLRYSDPRRIATYFAKHGLFSAKGYQQEPPGHWVAAIRAGSMGGMNAWGYWGLKKATVSVEIQRRAGASRPAAVTVGFEPVRYRQQRPRSYGLVGDDARIPHYVSLRWGAA
jgi:hypothetical protein